MNLIPERKWIQTDTRTQERESRVCTRSPRVTCRLGSPLMTGFRLPSLWSAGIGTHSCNVPPPIPLSSLFTFAQDDCPLTSSRPLIFFWPLDIASVFCPLLAVLPILDSTPPSLQPLSCTCPEFPHTLSICTLYQAKPNPAHPNCLLPPHLHISW